MSSHPTGDAAAALAATPQVSLARWQAMEAVAEAARKSSLRDVREALVALDGKGDGHDRA